MSGKVGLQRSRQTLGKVDSLEHRLGALATGGGRRSAGALYIVQVQPRHSIHHVVAEDRDLPLDGEATYTPCLSPGPVAVVVVRPSRSNRGIARNGSRTRVTVMRFLASDVGRLVYLMSWSTANPLVAAGNDVPA